MDDRNKMKRKDPLCVKQGGSFCYTGNFSEIPCVTKTLREDAHAAVSKFTKLEKTSLSEFPWHALSSKRPR